MDSEHLNAGSRPATDKTRDLSAILRDNNRKIEEKRSAPQKERKRPKDEEDTDAKEARKGDTQERELPDDGRKPVEKPAAAKPEKAKGEGEKPAKEAKEASEEDQPFAPKTWSEAARKAFEAADPEVKRELDALTKNLHGGFTKRMQALAEDARLAAELRQHLKPEHDQFFKSRGYTPGRALAELMGAYEASQRDPAAFVKNIIKTRGLTAEQLGFTPSPHGAQPTPEIPGQSSANPEVAEIRQQLSALTNAWQTVQGQSRAHAQQRQAAAEQEVAQQIANFIHEVDPSGVPTHPHWDAVQNHVLMIARDDPDLKDMKPMERLQAAYERAVYANPATRAFMIEAERKKAAEETELARSRSALSKRPSGGGVAVKREKEDLTTIIRRNAVKLGAI